MWIVGIWCEGGLLVQDCIRRAVQQAQAQLHHLQDRQKRHGHRGREDRRQECTLFGIPRGDQEGCRRGKGVQVKN